MRSLPKESDDENGSGRYWACGSGSDGGNGGINIRAPIEELSPEQFQPVMNVNVTGTWLALRHTSLTHF